MKDCRLLNNYSMLRNRKSWHLKNNPFTCLSIKQWTAYIVCNACIFWEATFIIWETSSARTHVMGVWNAVITVKLHFVTVGIQYLLPLQQVWYLSNPCLVGRNCMSSPTPRCHFPTIEVLYPSAFNLFARVVWFVCRPPIEFAWNTPLYTPVDGG